MARTAVISGTATAVSGSVAQKQAQRHQAAQAQQQSADLQQQVDQIQAQTVQAQMQPQGSAPAQGDDLISQLARLGELHQQGILTAEEFSQAKSRLLNG